MLPRGDVSETVKKENVSIIRPGEREGETGKIDLERGRKKERMEEGETQYLENYYQAINFSSFLPISLPRSREKKGGGRM